MNNSETKVNQVHLLSMLLICSFSLLLLGCSGTEVVKLPDGATLEFQMVNLPGGEFQMGSDKGDDDERPVHMVTVQPFSIGKYEVTQEQWYKVMGENPSSFKAPKSPVENVSWEDIQEFLRRIGNGYRLPTEAEWEYAARAGSEAEYSFGEDPYETLIDEYAWYDGNSGQRTQTVGLKKPNRFGLYDMHGNVGEWVEDQYHDSYEGALIDGSAWTDGDLAANRVIRGGSWYNSAVNCRSAVRGGHPPGGRGGIVGISSGDLGFRLSRTLP